MSAVSGQPPTPEQVVANAMWGLVPDMTRGVVAVSALDALTAAGYVLVHLPEPSYTDEPEEDGVNGYGFNGGPSEKHLSERGVYAYDGQVFDQWDAVTADEARTIGSWWLAAAAAADGTGDK